MNPNARVCPNVDLGAGHEISEWVIIGEPPRGVSPGDLATRIGTDAVIRSSTVIYAGNVIGDRFQTGHGVLIREENRIGNDVSIGSHSVVEHHVEIGDGARIHSNAFIPEFSVLESGCWIGPGVVLTNARYPRSRTVKEQLHGPVVRKNAKIGAGAILLPGVVVGEGALIGAGAVVVADVPAGAVVVGNPARVIRHVAEIESYQLTSDATT